MPNILFFDAVSPHSYTSNSLTTRPMGASEASLMRIARSLSREPGFVAAVFQLCDENRTEQVIDGVLHVNGESGFVPDVVVHQRTATFVEAMRDEYPKAKHVVWLHDAAGDWLKDEPLHLADRIVCVSQWHRENILLGRTPPCASVLPDVVYNPIDLDNVAPETKVKGRLGFFSSPQKGLAQVCALFRDLKKDRPELELVVANPGYLPDLVPPGVRFLGQLPRPAALKELSKCECLFYPQTVFPETFGCVLAEANALGVPVLSHDHGAAFEVLCGTEDNHNANRVVDCTIDGNAQQHLANLLLNTHYVPVADPRFALSTVVQQWKQLLEGTYEAPTVPEPRQGG